MKIKKLVTVIIIAVVAVACAAAALAISYPNMDFLRKSAKRSNGKTMIFHLAEQTDLPEGAVSIARDGTVLEYVGSENFSVSKTYDVYKDASDNKYYYNSDGKLIMFNGSSEIVDTLAGRGGSSVPQDKAIAIADSYVKALFGSLTDEFELGGCQYYEDLGVTSVWYVQKLRGFAEAGSVSVDLLEDGSVSNCHLARYYDFADFDESLLDGVDRAAVEAFGREQFAKDHPNAVEVRVEAISLMNDDGRYRLDVGLAGVESDEYAETVTSVYSYPLK